MELPTITVVTPSLNQAQFLRQTICSVLSQRYPKLEYIVIDGGSTDGSVDIIRDFADRIQYWVSEPDRGQSHAINKGFCCATSDIVCWLNSDDLFLPGALQKVGRAFAQHPDVDVVTGYTVRTDCELRLLFNHFVPVQTRWLAQRGVFYFSQQSTFWRRGLLDEIGLLDESLHYSMDLDLWLRILASGTTILHTRHYLAAWRLHAECKSIKGQAGRDHDHAVLRGRYNIKDQGGIAICARGLYRFWKLIEGDYIKHRLFLRKWKGKPLSEFAERLSLIT